MQLTIDARYLKRPGVGISVYAADLIDELVTDHEVCLLTSQHSHADALRVAYPDCEVVTLPERREVTWEQSLLPSYLRSAGPEMHIAPANKGLPARSVPCKLALVVHDLIPLRMPRTHLASDPVGAARYLGGTAVSLARADLLVCNSLSTERDLRHILPNRPTFVRYPRVPQMPTTAAIAPEGWPATYLMYTGGYGARKNADLLLDAHAAYLAGGGTLPLVLLGGGYPALHTRLERLGTADMVTFAGHVDEQTKWAALSAAHTLVYPSSWEGFGLPILEGFAAGIPVISGTGGGQSEIGGDAVLYVDPLAVTNLAGLLMRVHDADLRARLVAAGKAQLESVQGASSQMRLGDVLPQIEKHSRRLRLPIH